MTPRDRLFALEQFGIKLGLDNIRTLLEALGHPDSRFRSVHVAGTNGKGSVTAMVERGLRAAGHRTGRYTSPHLSRIEERIAVDGKAIAGEAFDALTSDLLALIDRLINEGRLPSSPTFFEVTTAMAFEHFRREEIDVAVIEVGLGGRFDATNVITPMVTVVTSIAFDHERYLGHSLREIAAEKAGIIKADVPVIIGRLGPEAREVIEATARRLSAPVVPAVISTSGTPLALSLQGAHQRDNAAIATTTFRVCTQRGISVAHEHIVAALTDVDWPARLEWLRIGATGDVLLDAAHNPAGAEALAAYLRDERLAPIPFIIGVMADKAVDGIAAALAPLASRVIATQAASPRAMPAEELATVFRRVAPATNVESVTEPRQALRTALTSATRAVVVAGSIFLVGPLREELRGEGAYPVRYSSKAGPFFLA